MHLEEKGDPLEEERTSGPLEERDPFGRGGGSTGCVRILFKE